MRLDSRDVSARKKPPKVERVLLRRKPHVPRAFTGFNILKDDEAATEHARAPSRLVAERDVGMFGVRRSEGSKQLGHCSLIWRDDCASHSVVREIAHMGPNT